MRKSWVLGVLVLMVVPSLMADPIYVRVYQDTSNFSNGNGGEFRAIVQTGNDPSAGYVDPFTKNVLSGGGFQVFCIEETETFSPGTEYQAFVSDKAVFGAGGALNGSDILSQGTAYLYSLFVRGTLPGYTYTTGINRVQSAGLLQQAIWYLEGEAGASLSAAYQALLINRFGSVANAKADITSTAQFGVGVMQLWDKGQVGVNGYQHQDMLVSVPDGGLTVILLGVAVACLVLISRRMS